MGGEIITVHLGQAGVQLSHALWELVCVEHGINATGRRIHEAANLDDHEVGREIVFREVRGGKFVPRALLVDLEPTVIDEVRTGAYRALWNPHNLINGKEDAASNFARGYYSQTRFEMADLMERLRALVEQCDNFACFKLLYSANGGTGSGLTSAVCERLSDEYGKKYKFATTVYPSPGYSELMVEPYNALLHSSTNLTFCDCVIITDNEATLNVAEEGLRLRHDGFTVPNRVIANAITTQFLSHRFKFIGQQNIQLDDLLINLIPYPRIHFPMMAFAPFFGPSSSEFEKTTAIDLVRGVFEDSNQLLSVSAIRRAYISCALLFRGAITPIEAVNAVAQIKGDRMGRAKFVDWCPTGFKLGVNFAYPVQAPTHDTVKLTGSSLSMIAGNLSIRDVWTGIGRRFDQLYEKRAFVHWYVAEGMEEGEFSLAREVIQQLVEDYEAIAKDAEGALFEESSNQSQNQMTKSSVRVTSLHKRSPANGTDINMNQATTLDDPNSLRTLENNDEHLSLDTNQHHGGSRGPRLRNSHARSYADSDSFHEEDGSKWSRIRSSQRRRLHGHNATPPQPLPIDKIPANRPHQQSSNALVETLPQQPIYGTNCSAAVGQQAPIRPSKTHRHHRRKSSHSAKHLEEENYVYPVIHSLKQERTTKQESGIPVFSGEAFEVDIYKKAKEFNARAFRSSLHHTHDRELAAVSTRSKSGTATKANSFDEIVKLEEPSKDRRNNPSHEPELGPTVTESDSDSETLHVYPVTGEHGNNRSKRSTTSYNATSMVRKNSQEAKSHNSRHGEVLYRNSINAKPAISTTDTSSSENQDHSIVSVSYDDEPFSMIDTGNQSVYSSRSYARSQYQGSFNPDQSNRASRANNTPAGNAPTAKPRMWNSNEQVDMTYMSGTLQSSPRDATLLSSTSDLMSREIPQTDVRPYETQTMTSRFDGTLVSDLKTGHVDRIDRINYPNNKPSQIPVGFQFGYEKQRREAQMMHSSHNRPNFISTATILGNSAQHSVVREDANGTTFHANYLSTTVIKVRNFAQMLPTNNRTQAFLPNT